MHLLRMELENFKSFGGDVIIPLDEGFTAITGPNGSGKSNTLDALEFVLGPKSTKSLRAANVTQLIFNGGKRGRPAKHMSASLVFSNTPELGGRRRLRIDTDEVRFTRTVRLGRKGDPISSYRINDEPSTATEMRRVMAEAGLRAGGYNIVKQGDVTTLATMTPHKRRGVLEEVAGVTAYDDEIRRASTQRKHVENNIETIDLFEDEQKKRLKDLGKEREQALKFKSLKEELDTARISLHQSRHRNRLDDVQLLGTERSGYHEEIETIGGTITEGNKELLALDEEMVKVDSDINEIVSGEARDLFEKIRQYQIDIETGGDRIGDQRSIIESAEEDAEEFRAELRGAQSAHEQAETALEAASEALEDAKESLKRASEDERDAREAIESGDKAGRGLKRILGHATEAVDAARCASTVAAGNHHDEHSGHRQLCRVQDVRA